MSQNLETFDIQARRVAVSRQTSGAHTAHQSPPCPTEAVLLVASLQHRTACDPGTTRGQAGGSAVGLIGGGERMSESESERKGDLMWHVAKRDVKGNLKNRHGAGS